ncbi:transposase [Bradyrhizobium sp. CIAT3101]|uniref:IS66 family transposase n=1 Tax=Bradyrhizobium sp. CIAT3101 TaxID=439387 RepID=UPI0024B16E0D|nr:transposase [Bradyrhizobium sp. CIAT3101]WFU80565.1 transposase [Bradyrhizobium sp. CIAT3101]
MLEPFAPALRQIGAQQQVSDRRRRCRQIAQLSAIKAMVRGSWPDVRLATRKEHSSPLIAALKPCFEKQLSMISSGSTLAEDICYALNHWQGADPLPRRASELDTNPVENAIRPVCLTRKNALFAGHEIGAENWAMLASIVATCKLNNTRGDHRRLSP